MALEPADLAAIIAAITPTSTGENQMNEDLTTLLSLQSLGEVKKDVYQAANTNQVATMQAQIDALRGQAGLAQDISHAATESALGFGVVGKNVSDVAGILGVNIVNATAGTNNLVSTATNLLNSNMLKGFADSAAVTVSEAEKTRALITSNYVADLNTKNIILAGKLAEAHENHRFALLQAEINSTKQGIINLGTMTGSANPLTTQIS
jgi:hypothetical protein